MQAKLSREHVKLNICTLWKRAEPKSSTRVHVQEISDQDDGAASSMPPPHSY
jgi:hypothetical protein